MALEMTNWLKGQAGRLAVKRALSDGFYLEELSTYRKNNGEPVDFKVRPKSGEYEFYLAVRVQKAFGFGEKKEPVYTLEQSKVLEYEELQRRSGQAVWLAQADPAGQICMESLEILLTSKRIGEFRYPIVTKAQGIGAVYYFHRTQFGLSLAMSESELEALRRLYGLENSMKEPVNLAEKFRGMATESNLKLLGKYLNEREIENKVKAVDMYLSANGAGDGVEVESKVKVDDNSQINNVEYENIMTESGKVIELVRERGEVFVTLQSIRRALGYTGGWSPGSAIWRASEDCQIRLPARRGRYYHRIVIRLSHFSKVLRRYKREITLRQTTYRAMRLELAEELEKFAFELEKQLKSDYKRSEKMLNLFGN